MAEDRDAATASTTLRGLREDSLRPVEMFAAALGTLWLWLVLWPEMISRVSAADWIGGPALLLGALLSHFFRTRPHRVSALALVVSFMVGSTCAALAFGRLEATYSFAVAIILSSVLLGQWGTFASATISAAIMLYLGLFHQAEGAEVSSLAATLGGLSLVAIASWLSADNLYTALSWFEHSYELARRSEAAALDRRGELRRALDALNGTMERLDRTNQELVTARQEAEQERAHKEQFVANVSHELRTPLNLVVGFAEMMYLSPESYEGVEWTRDLVGDVGEMYRAARQLLALVNDILDLSRIEARRLPMLREWVSPNDVVREVEETVRPLLRQRRLWCHLELSNDVPPLLIDRLRLRQVLINLLNNAARFTDTGGITIRTEVTQDSVVTSVQDTGVGIPKDQIETIFESFNQSNRQVRRGGAGLGLAISRELVELHGGHIWVTSQIGTGSTFSFSLPLPEAVQASGLHRLPAQERRRLTDAPVIVVDPDPEVSAWFRRYLEGHPIVAAEAPCQAGAMIEAHHPRAVIVNRAPDRPSDDLPLSLRTEVDRYSVPLIHCSIPSANWIVESTGIDGLLMKPVSHAALRHVVEKYCVPNGTVLVVDDNPGFVELLNRMLRSIPEVSQVRGAHSGTEGLRLAREFSPDLILVDLLMPDMSGFDVLRALRDAKGGPQPRVIVVTATSYAEEALQHCPGHFSITQAHGLDTRAVVDLISTALTLLRPDYLIGEETASSA